MDYVLLRVHTIVRDTVTSITTNETKHVLKAQNHIRTVLTRILVSAMLVRVLWNCFPCAKVRP